MANEPALPWGNVEPENAADAPAQGEGNQPQEQEPERGLTLEEAGIAAATRVEVKWQVEPDGGEPYARWWGATVVGPSIERDPQRADAPTFELQYDAHDDFEPESSHVIFTSEHTLRQLDQEEELTWRKEGDAWEDEEEDGEEGEELPDGEAVLSMGDIVKHEKEMLGGKTLEEAEGEVLAAMEPSKRIAVAAGFRDFSDNLISFLKDTFGSSADGEAKVVTEEHIRAFMENMGNKKQRTH
ncbi:hypothetical protein HYH03_004949 [Edaphochlamys debaryana]|uniref:Uncharacterized protein n=1 Tax=Edaphochlamys debaryana TaxID=47281 RepID=A0A835Y8X6_9CHLO|nr:hypothetical protein HYH03_004949 [Edaphochlamys debaryana]|eukprot:KAG2496943.1 hypothetical protein HYH03_004949 [Edaphochlamys debaryana]